MAFANHRPRQPGASLAQNKAPIPAEFTTVPRPQESWSDPAADDMKADVFSYSAVPMFLGDGETATLVPGDGSHVPPHPRAQRARRERTREARP